MPVAFAGYLQVLKCVPFDLKWCGALDSFFMMGEFAKLAWCWAEPSSGGSSRFTGASLGRPFASCPGLQEHM